jgi:hypothetical protein
MCRSNLLIYNLFIYVVEGDENQHPRAK